MAKNIYLPSKNANWNDPTTLGDKEDMSKNLKAFGDMIILNTEGIKDAVKPPVDEEGKYTHKDGEEDRHPQTLYLVPGNPRHRSDSLFRPQS
jgi:hypothetical protein